MAVPNLHEKNMQPRVSIGSMYHQLVNGPTYSDQQLVGIPDITQSQWQRMGEVHLAMGADCHWLAPIIVPVYCVQKMQICSILLTSADLSCCACRPTLAGNTSQALFWVAVQGGRWRIDWPRTNRGS